MSISRVSVCPVDDISDGQMRQYTVAGRDVLLVRRDESFYAIAAHCSHYGAPLENGVLCKDRVVCPWHNACFSFRTGELLEPPGRDNLKRYDVSVQNNTVYIDIPVSKVDVKSSVFVEEPLQDGEHVVPTMAQPDVQKGDRPMVIVGGGAAGNAAAEILRQKGFQGRIVMLTADHDLPYDRTKLSKAYLQSDSAEDPDLLRSADFYDKHGIEVRLNACVTNLDVEARQLTYNEGEVLAYEAVLLATGGQVRQLSIDGIALKNIFTLRQADDAAHILKTAQNAQRAVVVGGGFIGMEVAASLKQQGLEVTVITSRTPFENVLGKEVGRLFQKVHEDKGVQFKLGTKAKAFVGDTQVESVVLDSGETLPADLVVVGIGVVPATDFLQDDLLDERDRGVVVDKFLQAAPHVYAAGDIARFPNPMTGEPVRIEHWRLALQHGRIAANNMVDESIPLMSIPFFWTGQFGLKLRYVGHAEAWDEVVIQGDLEKQEFLAFYVQSDRILAVAGIGRDRDIAAISELMRLNQMPSAKEVRGTDINWVEALNGEHCFKAA
ncbi:FAD-dependent oxidoreductase [Oscillatoria sp. CS-180]|uniref:FAD-dependent oxidoreductase n=1 Tax=Oscillatoria sp. CS-180 TaxID=3021720 RepID=UPI00232CC70A|nr:FAD-dependent oxidoreductase [Oscillatoria sp. CS-180]MDB9524738.1 FAD-dependent oxidoreductase [Oscillatoria sp. CS-180]